MQQQARFPRWLSWIILIGMGYIIVTGNQNMQRGTAPKVVAEEAKPTPTLEDTPQLKAFLDADRWAKAINPDYKSPRDACNAPAPESEKLGSYAIVLKEGEGQALLCAQQSEFTITRWGNDGKALKPQQVMLTMGEQPALDALLTGMRIGEQRLVIVRLPERAKALPSLPPKNQLILNVERLDPVPQPAPNAAHK